MKNLEEILKERIAIIDGAMGTMVQRQSLEEADFRGEIFKTHSHDLKGNNEVLSLTRPDVIEQIHYEYLSAGADIIETNTFGANTISQSDYALEEQVVEMNLKSSQIARRAVDRFINEKEGRVGFVAGAIGPTTKTASLSRDVSDPAARAVTFDSLKDSYFQQASALWDGGVDLFLVETIFDTLNAKAALFALEKLFEEKGSRLPVMISVTVADASGRTLSGQTIEAFYYSISHVKPLSVGLNCALGPKEIRPYLEELATLSKYGVSCYPNAGLPDPLSPTGFPETPETLAPQVEEFAKNGWINIVGGCCGTTPDHIRAIAEAVKKYPPRKILE